MTRGEICPSRQSRRECKNFASGVNFFPETTQFTIEIKVQSIFYPDFISKTDDILLISSFITKNAQIIDI